MSLKDCWSVDEESLEFIIRPCYAFILLFPWDSAKLKEARKFQEEKIEKEGQILSEKLFFMEQIVENACGSIAVVHSILNNLECIQLDPNSLLGKYYEQAKSMDIKRRGEFLGEQQVVEEVSNSAANNLGSTKVNFKFTFPFANYFN